ncbi:PTS sugar transporter subunit IIB [Marinococcus sp. PL1-022]|uniref:PTS sugar transporter subunit IIB n=1 Tax=Marinococcus sp. PL1-022 TaxID=3095363 RepID=UPI0029C5F031|nr:PTS sugar transporter subunit IIB [Marinococcus sp. PL1-022]MDX6152541.1 PTS sugar transporter subunit IIB [Marinococcus sp. PL1-022]
MKILTVCGLGQGTSLILKMNVETALEQKNIEADVEHMDVSSASGVQADYIITNQELAPNLEGHKAKLIIVQNYFDPNEISQAIDEQMQD